MDDKLITEQKEQNKTKKVRFSDDVIEKEDIAEKEKFIEKEKFVKKSDVDLNDFEFAPEEKEHARRINIMNIFTIYYKQLFNKEKESHMFEEINYEKENSTNRCMELLFEEIVKYNKCEDQNITKLYNEEELDIEKCPELYALLIDNKVEKVCQLLIPLIVYLAGMEWTNIDWSIHPIKTIN